jgi:hypothetical protein
LGESYQVSIFYKIRIVSSCQEHEEEFTNAADWLGEESFLKTPNSLTLEGRRKKGKFRKRVSVVIFKPLNQL